MCDANACLSHCSLYGAQNQVHLKWNTFIQSINKYIVNSGWARVFVCKSVDRITSMQMLRNSFNRAYGLVVFDLARLSFPKKWMMIKVRDGFIKQ